MIFHCQMISLVIFLLFILNGSALNPKVEIENPIDLGQQIRHIEQLSGGILEVHFANGQFVDYDQNLMQINSFALDPVTVFKQLNYFNQTFFVGLPDIQNKAFVYNKLTKTIEKTNPSPSTIIYCEIIVFDSTQKIIFVVEADSIKTYDLNTNSPTPLFTLTNDKFVLHQTIDTESFILSTQLGYVYYFKHNLLITPFTVKLETISFFNFGPIDYLFPIFVSGLKFYALRTKSNRLILNSLQDYIQVPFKGLNFTENSLISVKCFNETHIYFFFINSQARVSLINEQLVVQEVQPYLDSPSQDSITTVVDQNSFLVSASVFDIKSMFYQVNSFYLYRFTYCQGQTAYNNLTGTCEAYQCTDATNCQSCPTNKDLCQSCIAGYEVINWKCDKICNISFCFQCETNTTCKVCQNNYNLTSDKTCVIVDNNSTNTNNNSTNNNNNSTNPNNNSTNPNNNSTDPNNGTEEKSYTDTKSFTFTKEQLMTKYESLPSFVKSLTESSKTLNSFPMARILLKFLLPMFAFFDDYWFYIYHDNNSFEDFDKIAKLFSIMYVINTDRFVSQLLHTDEFLEKFGYESYLKSSYLNYTNVAIIEIDEIDTNYLRNSQEMICFQYFTTLATFFLLKLIASFFLFVKSKLNARKVNPSKEQQQKAASENIVTACLSFLSRTVIDYLEDSSQWFQLLISFIEANLIFIGFQVGTQFFVFFSFNFLDKFNMVIAVLYGAVALFFAFIFYFTQEGDTLRIYIKQKISQKKMAKKDKKKMNKKKQVPKKYPKKQKEEEYPDEIVSFRLEVRFQTYFGCLKTLVFGFLHAVLLYANYVQLGSLMVVKMVMLVFTIKLFMRFRQTDLKWTLMPLLVYFLFGIGFDILLILGKMKKNGLIWIEDGTLELMEITVLIGLFASILSEIIVPLLLLIKQKCSSDEQNQNDIKPEIKQVMEISLGKKNGKNKLTNNFDSDKDSTNSSSQISQQLRDKFSIENFNLNHMKFLPKTSFSPRIKKQSIRQDNLTISEKPKQNAKFINNTIRVSRFSKMNNQHLQIVAAPKRNVSVRNSIRNSFMINFGALNVEQD